MTALHRSAAEGTEVLGVDLAQRVVTLVVVPFDEPAWVEEGGELFRETFARGAFDETVDLKPSGVRVNRDHDRTRTVGKVIAFRPNDFRGLVADIQIAKTALGDETLALAAEGCLSASIGAAVRRGDVLVDRSARTRRVTRAYVDHVALVESPALSLIFPGPFGRIGVNVAICFNRQCAALAFGCGRREYR